MKRRIPRLSALAALVGLLAVTGCKSVATNSHQYLGSQSYPPSDPAQVQILREAPTRPHVKLGEVEAQPSSGSVGNPQIEQALQKTAAKLGANAVVIVADHTQVVGATVTGPGWARSVYPVSGRVIVGVAIRYTQP
jgi:energy-converting hydrogenase Eha subunit F